MRESKSSNVLTSIIDGNFWKRIEKQFAEKLVIPLLLYFDDFEINNPLGSHSGIHKIGAIYCTIPTIPDIYSSMLENIFLLQLHNEKDHLQLGNKSIFSNIINEIIDLENNGLDVKVNGKQHKIYFACILLVYCIISCANDCDKVILEYNLETNKIAFFFTVSSNCFKVIDGLSLRRIISCSQASVVNKSLELTYFANLSSAFIVSKVLSKSLLSKCRSGAT